jgi:hypothetical protein
MAYTAPVLTTASNAPDVHEAQASEWVASPCRVRVRVKVRDSVRIWMRIRVRVHGQGHG